MVDVWQHWVCDCWIVKGLSLSPASLNNCIPLTKIRYITLHFMPRILVNTTRNKDKEYMILSNNFCNNCNHVPFRMMVN